MLIFFPYRTPSMTLFVFSPRTIFWVKFLFSYIRILTSAVLHERYHKSRVFSPQILSSVGILLFAVSRKTRLVLGSDSREETTFHALKLENSDFYALQLAITCIFLSSKTLRQGKMSLTRSSPLCSQSYNE